jgi:hypothetical protein
MTKAPENPFLPIKVLERVGRFGTPIGQRGAGFRFFPLTATSQLVIAGIYMQNMGQTAQKKIMPYKSVSQGIHHRWQAGKNFENCPILSGRLTNIVTLMKHSG